MKHDDPIIQELIDVMWPYLGDASPERRRVYWALDAVVKRDAAVKELIAAAKEYCDSHGTNDDESGDISPSRLRAATDKAVLSGYVSDHG